MRYRYTIFTRIVILLLLFLIPILLLYFYSNRVSVGVVKDEMKDSIASSLGFLGSQIESEIDGLSTLSGVMARDPSLQALMDAHLLDTYELNKTLSIAEQKLKLQALSSRWSNQITVYFPEYNYMVSNELNAGSYPNMPYSGLDPNWNYEIVNVNNSQKYQFVRRLAEPYRAYDNPELAKQVLQISFSPDHLKTMLGQYKSKGKGEAFLYHPRFEPILAAGAEYRYLDSVVKQLRAQSDPAWMNRTLEADQEDILVNSLKIAGLNWYVVEYVPIREILSPIEFSKWLFYGSIALILGLGIIASFLLFRHVQVPIIRLVRAIGQLRDGNYAVRVRRAEKSDFDVLYSRFNDMAADIQELIEKVHVEELRLREATVKQLQSQINPHFLYNCLFYMANMSTVGDDRAVTAMAMNLGEYYRYTTRSENQTPTLREELQLIENYLQIQKLRLDRVTYEIDVPPQMLGLSVPRLLLQPLVENAILHGIEPRLASGLVRIQGRTDQEGWHTLRVQDSGCGMTEEEVAALRRKLSSPLAEGMGCGLWNVHQRLLHQFAPGSGLIIQAGGSGEDEASGGMSFMLRWKDDGLLTDADIAG